VPSGGGLTAQEHRNYWKLCKPPPSLMAEALRQVPANLCTLTPGRCYLHTALLCTPDPADLGVGKGGQLSSGSTLFQKSILLRPGLSCPS
jgi:hypothetical protein